MPVRLETSADGVAVVTLDRPEVLNALDIPAKRRLAQIWAEIAADPSVRVAVIEGAGPRAFCVGSDVKEIARTGGMVSTDDLLNAIPGLGVPLDKPVVAALHGHCVGFGMTLAIHCDLRIVQEGARMAFPEVPHGMISGVSAVRLPRMLPQALAMEMLLTGRPLPPDEALRHGFVNAVVEDARAEARAVAARIAGFAPDAVQATRRLAALPWMLDAATREEVAAMRARVETAVRARQAETVA